MHSSYAVTQQSWASPLMREPCIPPCNPSLQNRTWTGCQASRSLKQDIYTFISAGQSPTNHKGSIVALAREVRLGFHTTRALPRRCGASMHMAASAVA